MLGRAIGKTTDVLTLVLLFPRVEATSFKTGGTSCREKVIDATAFARKSNA
jgi:hypothetical protein